MSARTQRAAALLIGGTLAALFSLGSAVQVAGWTVGAVEKTDSQVISGPVDAVSVDAGAGEIVVLPSQGDFVRVDSSVKGRLRAGEPHAVKEGRTVHLDGNCPDISFGPCKARIVIHVPPAAAIDVRSGSGDLTATGLRGPVRLKTGSGAVNVSELSGDADVHTGSGDVDARGLRGGVLLRTGSGDINAEDLFTRRVKADTSSGDVEVGFRLAPVDVDLSTASGDIDVAVPAGGAYRVEGETGSGAQQVEVRTDPASRNVIRARTSSGDVTVGYGN